MLEELKNKLKKKGELSIGVKVHPGAKRNTVKEIMGNGVIKIDIAEAPEKGRANIALIKFLAKEFKVSKDNIKIIAGETSKLKKISIINNNF